MAKHARESDSAAEGQQQIETDAPDTSVATDAADITDTTATVQSTAASASGFDPASLHFVTKQVSDAERAAVTAVLGNVLEQESAMLGQAPGTGTSAWQRSQRPLRGTITPGHHRWNRSEL